MSYLNINKRELCVRLIEHGKHISTVHMYIKERFPGLTEANNTCTVARIQKYLLPEFKQRWNKAGRSKDIFLTRYAEWLNGDFRIQFDEEEAPSTSHASKRGRPCKDYELSSARSKHRQAIRLFQESGLDHIHHSYMQGLKSIGKSKHAAIIEQLRSMPTETLDGLHKNLMEEKISLVPYSNDEALALLLDLDLTKQQYEYFRKCITDKNLNLFPAYKYVLEAKTQCYPDNMEISDIGAKIKLQSLLDHTVTRLLMLDSINLPGGDARLILYCKWGCDGSSGQSEYKQILSGESKLISDANLLIASLVPLKLVSEVDESVIWQNPSPSSVRFCRPILIEFAKETPEKTRSIVTDIETQILALTPSSVLINTATFSIKHTLYFTMVDGKVVQVLTNTPSSANCNVCLAKPSEMNDLVRVSQKPEREETFRFGLSTLHAWIRFMELVLHVSYNLPFQKWSATTEENKKLKAAKKQLVQDRFRNEYGLIIDKPRHVSGNTNDGNTARRFFANSSCTSQITGVDETLLRRFYIILQTMSCGRKINPRKFGEYARSTAELYVNKYNWYYMPSSVHKVLIHGESIITYNSILPLGQLSEDAQESRNKDYKKFRLHHSRKCSRTATNEDVFHTLLCSSDPFISCLRRQHTPKHIELDEEALNLLDSDE